MSSVIKIFGDSNVWGDEQPGCTIGKNSKSSKSTFPYYIASLLNCEVENFAVSGAALNLVHDMILFNPVNKDDIVIVYLPTCSKYGFIHNSRDYEEINDVIRYKLRSQIFNKDMGEDTIKWMNDNMWHPQALYYNTIKYAYAILKLTQHSNVFFFWNTRHTDGKYLSGQDGLYDELKRRNNYYGDTYPTEIASSINFSDEILFQLSLITVDWDCVKSLDEITAELNLYKYPQGHHLPRVHFEYAHKIIDVFKERLNVY